VRKEVLIVVFDQEHMAQWGADALHQMNAHGDVAVNGIRIIMKNSHSSVRLDRGSRRGDLAGTLTGALLGSLVGLLFGPAGIGVGMFCGAILGSIADG
jgi:uncharacterized membrane protein